MKSSRTLLLAMAIGAAAAANAGPGQAPAEVQGVRIASLCAGCGVVSAARTETRKGQASGIGAVGGAVVGGVIGNQFGHGNGRAAMTALGAVGGGFAGHEIEKNVKRVTVWSTTVRFKDGSTHRYESTRNPQLAVGDIVRIRNGHPVKVRT